MAVTAQAWEFENTLAENAYAIGQNRQSMTGYLPDPVTCHSLSSQPFYMNTVPRTTNMDIPIAESTLVLWPVSLLLCIRCNAEVMFHFSYGYGTDIYVRY